VILLDTNVVSEPLKLNADPTVVAWIDAQLIETLYLHRRHRGSQRLTVATRPYTAI
jgi:toxin FitB